MKVLWCWRCKLELPMLDEEEFSVVKKLYSEGMMASKDFRTKHNLTLGKCTVDERFRPMREAYERMTGMAESNENAIVHHRIELYGPPCEECGKPLRTKEASFCAACGRRVQ